MTIKFLLLLAILAIFQTLPILARHRHAGYSCAECNPGYGASRQCTRHLDTVCTECRPGTYSRHRNAEPCWICSRCGPGLYEYRKCTRTADTICDTCQRADPGNPDYERKCGGWNHSFFPPRSAEETAAETTTADPGKVTQVTDLIDHSKDGSDAGQMPDPYEYLLGRRYAERNTKNEEEPQFRHEKSREKQSDKTW